MTDFETWLHDFGYDRLFRMLIKRRVGDWTPYEWDQKFVDESQYEDTHYTIIKIIEAIELPDKDVLIGYKKICDRDDIGDDKFYKLPISYNKLSEVELFYFPEDIEDFYGYKDDEYED